MFDNITTKIGVTQEVTFNAISGTLIKSTENSKFIRFHRDSGYSKTFFDADRPYMRLEKADDSYTKNYYLTILQVMLCSDDEFLVEYLELD